MDGINDSRTNFSLLHPGRNRVGSFGRQSRGLYSYTSVDEHAPPTRLQRALSPQKLQYEQSGPITTRRREGYSNNHFKSPACQELGNEAPSHHHLQEAVDQLPKVSTHQQLVDVKMKSNHGSDALQCGGISTAYKAMPVRVNDSSFVFSRSHQLAWDTWDSRARRNCRMRPRAISRTSG